jgi:hypothetical protein
VPITKTAWWEGGEEEEEEELAAAEEKAERTREEEDKMRIRGVRMEVALVLWSPARSGVRRED